MAWTSPIPTPVSEDVYATSAQLAAFTGQAAPADADRLLARASEAIDEYIIPNVIDLENADHVLAAQKATCAQVEFWLAEGEQRDTHGPVAKTVAGKMQEEMDPSAPKVIAYRARRILRLAGLCYRGADSTITRRRAW